MTLRDLFDRTRAALAGKPSINAEQIGEQAARDVSAQLTAWCDADTRAAGALLVAEVLGPAPRRDRAWHDPILQALAQATGVVVLCQTDLDTKESQYEAFGPVFAVQRLRYFDGILTRKLDQLCAEMAESVPLGPAYYQGAFRTGAADRIAELITEAYQEIGRTRREDLARLRVRREDIQHLIDGPVTPFREPDDSEPTADERRAFQRGRRAVRR